MQLPVETIRELAKLADVKVTTSNSMSDEEEEELWSYIAGNVNIEREFEEKEEAENILNKVDKVFQELRAKQQPIVSDDHNKNMAVSGRLGAAIFFYQQRSGRRMEQKGYIANPERTGQEIWTR